MYRIGRSRPVSGTRALPPAQYGMEKTINARIANTVARHTARVAAAMRVDGIPLQVWRQSATGQLCTCSTSLAEVAVANGQLINGSLVDSIGSSGSLSLNTDAQVDDLQAVQVRFGHHYPKVDDKSKWPSMRQTQGPDSYDQDDVKSLSELRSLLSDPFSEETDDNLPQDTNPIYAADDLLRPMTSDSKTPCGICFGTGYHQGYDLFGGHRFIFEPTTAQELNGFALDTTAAPYSVKSAADPTNYIQWRQILPRYFLSILALNVVNKNKRTQDFSIKMRQAGTSIWYTMSSPAMLQTYLNGLTGQLDMEIRLTPKVSDPELVLAFTHLELVLMYVEPQYGQLPNFQESANMEFYEVLATTNIEIPPSIPDLTRGSVIYENKTGNLWKVIDITRKKTAQDQLFGYETNVRRVQPSETLFLLNYAAKRDIDIASRGLEQVQGSNTWFDELP